MMGDVYIRPLEPRDALTSYKWRNDPEVWKFTGGKPDRIITADIEKEWIAKVLKNENEKRFAICTTDSNQYIGNIQLTNIGEGKAQYHIFIGEKAYWGKGLAKGASQQILRLAFDELQIESVYLEVNPDNASAVKLYTKMGFKIKNVPPSSAGFLVMNIDRADFTIA
jgi:RimJ/RimL family protein N-acetyltransferase